MAVRKLCKGRYSDVFGALKGGALDNSDFSEEGVSSFLRPRYPIVVRNTGRVGRALRSI